jgi:hypothetical protein
VKIPFLGMGKIFLSMSSWAKRPLSHSVRSPEGPDSEGRGPCIAMMYLVYVCRYEYSGGCKMLGVRANEVRL